MDDYMLCEANGHLGRMEQDKIRKKCLFDARDPHQKAKLIELVGRGVQRKNLGYSGGG